MNPLSLDHLTILDTSPPELVSIAAETGCPLVSLWVIVPVAGNFPLVDASNRGETARRLKETGVKLHNVECIGLSADFEIANLHRPLELAAELGARTATAICLDPDRARLIDNFARLCELAAEFSLGINVEFFTMGTIDTLESARHLLNCADQANAAITIDILHLIRTGGTQAAIKALPANLIGYAQICDGPAVIAPDDRVYESFEERQLPGEGSFPLREFLASLPAGVPLGIEVPQKSQREKGITPLQRARRVVNATRSLLRG